MSAPPSRGTFSRDEAHAILDRAIERSHEGALTYDELVATARELGIPAASVERAALEIADERTGAIRAERQRAARRRGLANHGFSYAVIIGMLAVVNVLTSTAYLWFVWPALAWGVALAFHARAALMPPLPPKSGPPRGARRGPRVAVGETVRTSEIRGRIEDGAELEHPDEQAPGDARRDARGGG
jgi:hypothetical protein